MNAHLEKLRDRYSTLDETFRARPLRERVILGGGIVATLLFCLDVVAIQPITEKIERIELAANRTQVEVESLEEQLQSLTNGEASQDEKRFRERKNLLLTQLREVDSKISSEVAGLVPPQAIVSVLEELLAPIRSLQIVSLQSQLPHRLGSGVSTASNSTLAEASGGLYRHAVRIEIEGDFAATVEFLERAEASRWHLLWDRLEYRVKEFPTATITIEIHTISDQEEWIGV